MDYNLFLSWVQQFIESASQVGTWLTTNIQIGSLSVPPLLLVTATGLIAFIGVALFKWILS